MSQFGAALESRNSGEIVDIAAPPAAWPGALPFYAVDEKGDDMHCNLVYIILFHHSYDTSLADGRFETGMIAENIPDHTI